MVECTAKPWVYDMAQEEEEEAAEVGGRRGGKEERGKGNRDRREEKERGFYIISELASCFPKMDKCKHGDSPHRALCVWLIIPLLLALPQPAPPSCLKDNGFTGSQPSAWDLILPFQP